MIQRIRRRFIRLAVLVLSVAMILIAGVINLVNWMNVNAELRQTLRYLADNAESTLASAKKSKSRKQQNALDEARYFLASVTDKGEVTLLDQARLSREDAGALRQLVLAARAEGAQTGRMGSYLFAFQQTKKKTATGIFLNIETQMDGVRTLLYVSAGACAAGILLSWLVILALSSRLIRPMVRSAIQQKQFITDAGHELKTPLTVISADMDALTIQTGTNEWIDDTRKQVSNMRGLVSGLIYLSRMDEDDAALRKEPVDLSMLVRDQGEAFQGMAEWTGKELRLSVPDGVIVRGDPEALKKLVSQLMENAVKYAPEGDEIAVLLEKKKKEVVFSTRNTLSHPMDDETLSHLFDRFYRPDASRSRDSGGHGIGLSMVRAVAEKHGGSVSASRTPDGAIRFVCRLPG